jgi:hypothetical protein
MKVKTITKIYIQELTDISEAIDFIEDNFHVKALHLTQQFCDSYEKWQNVESQNLYIEVTKIKGGYDIVTKVEQKVLSLQK